MHHKLTFLSLVVVSIAFPPELTEVPTDTIGQLYGRVTLTCIATGNPAPTITWFKDGQMLPSTDTNFFQYTISELGLEERGFYHCEAANYVDGSERVVKSSEVVVNIEGESTSTSKAQTRRLSFPVDKICWVGNFVCCILLFQR